MICLNKTIQSLPASCRVFMTGVTSIHGWPIYRALQGCLPAKRLYGLQPPKGKLSSSNDLAVACITDRPALERVREVFQPTHVIHCAGVCDLDVCEARPDWARGINVEGTRNVLEVFGDSASILFLSTDLVFSGRETPPGGYAEHHSPDPISVVGRTFAEAERLLLTDERHGVIRLSLPLGDSLTGDKGAIDWIESRLRRDLPVTLFHDEYRSCIDCDALGPMVLTVIQSALQGLYHFGGERRWSLHEIGEYVVKRGGYDPRLLTGIDRCEEIDGPPRVGDVSLDSRRLRRQLAGVTPR